MKHIFRKPTMPHWADFLTLLATIYPLDRLYSLTIAERFANWNLWVRPLPFTLASVTLIVFFVMPGAVRLWKTALEDPAHGRRPECIAVQAVHDSSPGHG